MRVDIRHVGLFRGAVKQAYPGLNLPFLNGITIDSSLVKKNDVFLAMKGQKTDGHNYIKQALDAGAAACIVERDGDIDNSTFAISSTREFLNKTASIYRESLNCPVIGITGSNGKTTTKDLLAHVFTADRNVMFTQGNFNSTIGVPLSIFEFCKDMDMAIIEMGASKPGEIEYICNIVQPNMGIITNIFEAHIEYFGSIERIAETKSALFLSLLASGTAFVNMDDKYIQRMKIPCKRVEFSMSKLVDFQGLLSKNGQMLTINGTSINLNSPSNTLGMNALAVFSIASYLGMDSIIIKQQIESFEPPVGRGNVISLRDFFIINDSYNSNLESAQSGINNLIAMKGDNRKIAVIGDMLELGNMDKKHHQNLGRYLSEQKVDAVFAFGDLTRYTINAMNGSNCFHQFYDDKNNLLDDLKAFLLEGDIIYIKGSRGMKMEEVIIGLQN